MTTVVWDGHALAADRRVTQRGSIVAQVIKIRRCADGRLIGASGRLDGLTALLDWLEQGGERPGFLDGSDEALEILPNGEVWNHLVNGKVKLCRGAQAIGSGGGYALVAVACGKSAVEAVRVAAKFDTGTGGKVDCLSLKEA